MADHNKADRKQATRKQSPRARALGWGVVGCSPRSIAEKRFIPALRSVRGGRLVAVSDYKLENVQRSARLHGCTPHASFEALLADPAVDVVYLGSPVFLHARQVRQAAAAGKHILCEKPLALTFAECRTLHAACQRHGVALRVGFMMRFHPLHLRLRRLVAAGRIGRIVTARAQLSHFGVEYNPDGSANWRQDPALSGGGAMMDMGIHCVDLLRFIVDLPLLDVSARIETLENPYAIEDTGALLFSFEGGAVGIVDSSFTIGGARHVLELHGTRGSILVENSISQVAEGEARLCTGPRCRPLVVQDRLDPAFAMYIREIEATHAAIRGGESLAATARDAFLAQAAVQTAYRAARARRTLPIPAFKQ